MRYERSQKLKSKFDLYHIIQRILIDIYHLQNINERELQAIEHDNRLIKINIQMIDELRKL